MQYKLAIWSLLLCFPSVLFTQSVLYSSLVSNDVNTRFEVIGKTGNFYWVYKSKRNLSFKKGAAPWPPEKDFSFEVYDGRLNHVKEIPYRLSDSVVKQYLITQKRCFDQLIFKKSANKTAVVINRFSQDGEELVNNAHLSDFPGGMAPEDFIITRSPDRSKILLLGFVPSDITPEIHAQVYTKDWQLLNRTVYKDGDLVQPLTQYDFTDHVLESSDAGSIKLTNNGDWLMVAPARRRNTYILCHYRSKDSSLVQMDIKQPQGQNIETCSLSLGEEQNAYVGILENLTDADKKVRMIKYNVSQSSIGYDTAYQFYLPNVSKREEHYLFEQEFIQIPGKGFMYMKEYGRSYFTDEDGGAVTLESEQEYAAHGSYNAKIKPNKKEYIRNSNLSDTKKDYDRGDLSVKYFPFQPTDSCWGGLLHVAQNTELSYSYLSYACVPSRDKIVFLYNVLATNENKFSSSTILDHKGQALDEGLIFWRSPNVLNFQEARLIDAEELFVPFERNRFQGFAIIRL